jgi:hypothetical protein
MTLAVSQTALERRDPPPRQKACLACVKAKRRCDFFMPSCSRCDQRHIACEYPPAVRRAAARHRRPQQQQHHAPLFVAEQMSAVQPTTTVTVLNPPPVGMTFEVSALGGDADLGLATFLDQPSVSVDFATLPPSSYSMDHVPVEDSWDATALVPPTQEHLSPYTAVQEMVQTRLEYTIEATKLVPRSMVLDLGTPWSHPELYRSNMPRSIRSRFQGSLPSSLTFSLP